MVVSLEGLRDRDLAFLRLVRRRWSACPVLLLAAEGRLSLARRAVTLGRTLLLSEPVLPEVSFEAAVLVLVPREQEGPATPGSEAQGAIRALLTELDHAIRNPLTSLSGSLQLAGTQGEWEPAKQCLVSVQRVGDVLDLARVYSRLPAPKPTSERLGSLLKEAIEVAGARGLVRLAAREPRNGPPLLLDRGLVRIAFDHLLRLLASRCRERPLPVRAGVRRLAPEARAALLAPANALPPDSTPMWEAVIQGRGVRLSAEMLRRLQRRILWSPRESREVTPGLATVTNIARLHGGALAAHPARAGTVIGIALPGA